MAFMRGWWVFFPFRAFLYLPKLYGPFNFLNKNKLVKIALIKSKVVHSVFYPLWMLRAKYF